MTEKGQFFSRQTNSLADDKDKNISFYKLFVELTKMRALILASTGLIALLAFLLVNISPQQGILILGSQAIIISLVYGIGNTYVEAKIMEEYEGVIDKISSNTEILYRRLEAVRRENVKLKSSKRGR